MASSGGGSFSWRDATTYGALGAPLAFVALPLYVHWPAFAADRLGLSLSLVGLVLLAMRCLDALIDPWLGSRIDGMFAQTSTRVWRWMAVACVAVAAGFAALFLPPDAITANPNAMVVWAAVALGLTYLGYSVAQIAHQAWGARLGGSAPYRAKVVGARELFALAGVVVASVLPSVAGWGVTAATLAAMLLVGMAMLRGAPAARDVSLPTQATASTAAPATVSAQTEGLLGPWKHAEFRTLVLVYVANGLASAVPATLFLFYVRDHLQLPQHEAAFLLGAGAHLGAGHGVGDCVVCVCRVAAVRCDVRLRCRLHRQWLGFGCRSGGPRRAAGRCDPAQWRGAARRRRLVRLVEPMHQAQPSVGRWHCVAFASVPGL
jgi:glycoside/pentoside/hexuronide:cation symporter, GPH family